MEFLIEVEARRNAEASERGAQDEHVHICCAHDDSHLAEWASGGGLLDDSPCDLFGLMKNPGPYRIDFAKRARRLCLLSTHDATPENLLYISGT